MYENKLEFWNFLGRRGVENKKTFCGGKYGYFLELYIVN